MISQSEMNDILCTALSTSGDFAELFFEEKNELNIKSSKALISGLTTVRISGVGIYVLSGIRSAYVYTNKTSFEELIIAAKKAAELIGGPIKEHSSTIVFSMQTAKKPNTVEKLPSIVPYRDKIRILKEIDFAARDTPAKILSLDANYFDTEQNVTIVNSEGLYTEDKRITVRVRLQATVSDGKSSEYRWGDTSFARGFEVFNERDHYVDFSKKFIKDIYHSMDADDIKPCIAPVVFDASTCGVFWHEAVGHPLESSAIAGSSSDFAGKIGEKVASDKVTVIDDGTLPDLYGSTAVDDEGTPTQKNTLIENGILKGYLCDRLGGRQLGMKSTGSGRKQSYTYAPTARMNNTYLAAGMDDEDEMIKDMDYGLFVKQTGGGNSGREFSVEVTEGYLVEKGEITKRIKGLVLNGRGIDLIKKVDRVGKKVVSESGSFCGAASGLCCVTSFGPRMRVSEMAIGGSSS